MEGSYYLKKNSRNSSGSSSKSSDKKHVQFYTSNNSKQSLRRNVPNTRQLKPECTVECRKIRQIICDVLRRNLWEESYDADHCNMLAMMTSEQIKAQVKLLNIPRYKIVCVVTVGSKMGQTFLQASRCLLNTEFDDIISESFENGSIFAVAVVYTFYQE